MPQYRRLYTKIIESYDFNEMPDDFTRLVWTLLPLGLDREGRSLDSVSLVKSRIMPLRDDVSSRKIADALEWFVSRGMIVRYSVDNRGYFYVPTFHEYQGDTKKEAPSIYPDPPALPTNSGPTPDPVLSKSSTDADAEVDSDSDSDSEVDAVMRESLSEAPTVPPPSEDSTVPIDFTEKQAAKTATKEKTIRSPAQAGYLKAFGKNHFKTALQATAIAECETEVGKDYMLAAIEWAALKGTGDIGAICKTARKMAKEGIGQSPTRGGNNGRSINGRNAQGTTRQTGGGADPWLDPELAKL